MQVNRFRLSNLSIRTRVAILILPLMLGVGISTGMNVAERYRLVEAMDKASALTRVAIDISALVQELQKERAASAVFVASKGEKFGSQLDAQRRATDQRRDGFETAAGSLTADQVGNDEADRIAKALAAFRQLDAIRQRISSQTIPADDSTAWFTGTIGAMLAVVPGFAAIIDQPDIARSLLSYSDLIQGKERAGLERATGVLGLALGRIEPAQRTRIAHLADQQDILFQSFALSADPGQAALLSDVLSSPETAALMHDRAAILAGRENDGPNPLTAASWFASATARIDLMMRMEGRISASLLDTASRTTGQARRDLCAIVTIAIVLLGVNALVALVTARSIVRPIAALTRAMGTLAAGDTSVEIPAHDQKDQIGLMARAVLVFKQSLEETARLTAARTRERQSADDDKRAALVGMVERIETETNGALEKVTLCAKSMTGMASDMAISGDRTGNSAREATGAATGALANAQTVASAAEQLSASIREISSQVNQSTRYVADAVGAAAETRAAIEALNEQVARIGTVADMIRDIAAKTNLLALNATIEAARAGEAGRGFSVVASEVKALASQTARSTEEITNSIGEVRSATAASVAAVGRIDQTVTALSAIAGSIAAAVEQQGAATAEIARGVAHTAGAVNQVTARIGEVSGEVEESGHRTVAVRDSAETLMAAVNEFRHAVIRVVRTSTEDVDRGQSTPIDTGLSARVAFAGASHG
jgi:methyl-accepting chemotaxis protein